MEIMRQQEAVRTVHRILFASWKATATLLVPLWKAAGVKKSLPGGVMRVSLLPSKSIQ